jgi:hypothetical protein
VVGLKAPGWPYKAKAMMGKGEQPMLSILSSKVHFTHNPVPNRTIAQATIILRRDGDHNVKNGGLIKSYDKE